MNLWNRIKTAGQVLRGANISASDWEDLLDGIEIGPESSAGVHVSESTGFRQATVFACVNILSRDAAGLPRKLYERKANGGRAEVTQHPVSEWLKRPNPLMTPFQYHQLAFVAQLTAGNTYSQVLRGTLGQIETWWLNPHLVEVDVRGRRRTFRVRQADGSKRALEDEEVLHSFGISGNGHVGISPIRHCMEAVGHAIAVGEYGGAYFKNPTPKIILKHPSDFSTPEARDEFVKRWSEKFGGKKGLATVAVLPNGMEVGQVVKIPNDEAQFIETSKWSKEAIAQIYGMPMHRLQALDKATFSNIEHQAREYVEYSLMPWITAYEQAMERRLLTKEESDRFSIRHSVDGLLRGDFQTRQEGLARGINFGFLTVNEARALENRPAVEGGDTPLVPLNLGSIATATAEPADEPPPADENSDERQIERNIQAGIGEIETRAAAARRGLARKYQPRLRRAFAKVLAADIEAVTALTAEHLRSADEKRSTLSLLGAIDEYYQARKGAAVEELRPGMLALALEQARAAASEIEADLDEARIERLIDGYLVNAGEHWARSSSAQLAEVVLEAAKAGADEAEAIEARLDEWERGNQGRPRAEQQADRDSVELSNAAAAAVFTAAGFALVWVTFGKNCPYCDELRGKRIRQGESFLGPGMFQPAGAALPLKIRGIKRHPPAHKGCDCFISPG